MDSFIKDLLYAGRGLKKNPGFAAVATLTIALGIGACTSIFSVVNAVLLRPLPYSNGDRLVYIWGELRARNVSDWPFSPPDFRDLRLQSTALFDDLAGIIPAFRTPIADGGGAGADSGQRDDAKRLPRLAPALIGRDFVDDDAMPQPEVPQPADGAQAIPAGPTAAGDRDPQPGPLAATLRQ